MLLLSLSNAVHDNAAVIADDYKILAAVQRERVARIKGDGGHQKGGSIHADMVAEALRVARVQASDIEQVVTSRGIFPPLYFLFKPLEKDARHRLCRLGQRKKTSAG